MVEMELVGVRVEVPSSSPIALLREVGGARRVLPIFIGAPEANAIAFALEEIVTPRPMTHDLLKDVLDDMGVSLEQVVVTELREGTFFAELELQRPRRCAHGLEPARPMRWRSPPAPVRRSSPRRTSSTKPATSPTRRRKRRRKRSSSSSRSSSRR